MKSTFQLYFTAAILSASEAIRLQDGEPAGNAELICEERAQQITNYYLGWCDRFRSLDADEHVTCVEHCESDPDEPETKNICIARCDARLDIETDLEKIGYCEDFAEKAGDLKKEGCLVHQ